MSGPATGGPATGGSTGGSPGGGRPAADGGWRPLRADRDFRRYFAARSVSYAGSGVTFVAMPVLVYGLTRSPLWTALVTVADAVPYLLLGLFAGAAADRLPRIRLMVGTDLASGVLIASVPLAYHLGVLSPVHVLVVAFAAQGMFVFFDAANFASLPALVGSARLPSANSLVFGTASALDVVTPLLAGLTLAVAHPSDLLAVDALTFVASALLVSTIRRPLDAGPRAAATVRADIREGLSFLWQHRLVRTMTWLGSLQSVGGGAFVALLVVWADRVLGVRQGDWRLGVPYGSWGAGAVIGTALLPGLTRRVGGPRVTLLALPASGVLGILTPLAGQWAVAATLFAMWGVAYMVVIVNAVTVRQQATPAHLQGRVNTTGRMIAFGLGWPLGAALGGLLAERYGPVVGMVVPAGIIAVAGAVAWLGPLRTAGRVVTPAAA